MSFEPAPPTADYACYQAKDTLIVLNTGTNPVSLNAIGFKCSTCLIYSETVTFSEPLLSLPGKNLGIFCNTFTLPTPSSLSSEPSHYTINVSGNNKQKQPTGDQKGDDGDAGGQVWLYVEDMSTSVIERLRIIARGGKGGDGGDITNVSTDPSKPQRGGQGGQGGRGGKVHVYYGSTPNRILRQFIGLKKQPWQTQVQIATKALTNPHPEESVFAAVPIASTLETLQLYRQYANGLNALSDQLSSLPNLSDNPSNPEPTKETLATSQACLVAIQPFFTSKPQTPQHVEKADVEGINLLATEIQNWKQSGGGIETEESLRFRIKDLISALEVNVGNQTSTLFSSLQSLGIELDSLVQSWETLCQTQMCAVEGGNGGQGGSSFYASVPPGSPGKPGETGETKVMNLSFHSSDLKLLDIRQVCVFPDQCQMLLNEADRLFFTNDSGTGGQESSVVEAGKLYSRLCTRLSFISLLDSPASEKSNLLQAYERLQLTDALMIAGLAQLQSIHALAQARLNLIMAGHDMFGHDPEWVPRSSFGFYRAQVTNLLTYLQSVEKDANQYADKWAQASKDSSAIANSLNHNRSMKAQADDNISLLTGPNGILATTAIKISLHTPLLKEQHAALTVKIKDLADVIKRSVSVDPQAVLDALASVSMAPSSVFAAATAAATAYKSFTTVLDEQGDAVQKDYVVSNVLACGDSLSSLTNAYITASDGTFVVGDPGGAKLLATAESLEKIVTSFSSAIPQRFAKDITTQLRTYMVTVQTRNAAVLRYNAALQTLVQAIIDSKYYDKMCQSDSQQLMMMNPHLPAVSVWLNKMRINCQMDIMQRLNYQARAGRFWWLTTGIIKFAPPGPLLGSSDLKANFIRLEKQFYDNVEQSKTWSFFPADEKRKLGFIYEMSKAEIKTLKTEIVDEDKTDSTYGVILQGFDPNISSYFPGYKNVRLSQVRVWLPGARTQPDVTGRQLLHIEISHLGSEKIVSPSGEVFTFVHDPVTFKFEYDAAKVAKVTELGPEAANAVFSKQAIAKDYSSGMPRDDVMAPIGPFALWRIEIHRKSNPGLDLTGVERVFVEFHGRGL